jgi:hypothetical protein
MIVVGAEKQTKEVRALLKHHAGSSSAETYVAALNGFKLHHNIGKYAPDKFSSRVSRVRISLNAVPFRKQVCCLGST